MALGRAFCIVALLHMLRMAAFPGEIVYTPYTFMRFAGGGSLVEVDGKGQAAGFWTPQGLATDAADNVYVADEHSIRKITPDATVTTLASGFVELKGVVVDAAGNVFVSSSQTWGIYKVSPEGLVERFAGNQIYSGSNDGIGTNATFRWPWGLAKDRTGNLYVADPYNFNIRKITPDAVVTTLAGMAGRYGFTDGLGLDARFYSPQGIEVDNSGNVMVGDGGRLRQISPDGSVTTIAGTAPGAWDGPIHDAGFGQATGLAFDKAGNLFVADYITHRVRRVDPQGFVTTLAGAQEYVSQPVEGTGSAVRFTTLWGIAVDSTGNLYVSDYGSHLIWKGIPATVVETPVRRGDSQVELKFNSTLHTTYTVLASTNSSDWVSIGTVAGTGNTVSFVDTNAIESQRFYRVQP